MDHVSVMRERTRLLLVARIVQTRRLFSNITVEVLRVVNSELLRADEYHLWSCDVQNRFLIGYAARWILVFRQEKNVFANAAC